MKFVELMLTMGAALGPAWVLLIHAPWLGSLALEVHAKVFPHGF